MGNTEHAVDSRRHTWHICAVAHMARCTLHFCQMAQVPGGQEGLLGQTETPNNFGGAKARPCAKPVTPKCPPETPPLVAPVRPRTPSPETPCLQSPGAQAPACPELEPTLDTPPLPSWWEDHLSVPPVQVNSPTSPASVGGDEIPAPGHHSPVSPVTPEEQWVVVSSPSKSRSPSGATLVPRAG